MLVSPHCSSWSSSWLYYIQVSGHRIGTAEVESALVGHPACAAAAVVPVDHPIKVGTQGSRRVWAAKPPHDGLDIFDKQCCILIQSNWQSF